MRVYIIFFNVMFTMNPHLLFYLLLKHFWKTVNLLNFFLRSMNALFSAFHHRLQPTSTPLYKNRFHKLPMQLKNFLENRI